MSKLNLSGHPNPILEAQGFVTLGLQVDLSQGYEVVFGKVITLLKDQLDPSSQATIVLPGLAPLAAIVMVAVHAITGSFPIVVPIARIEGQFLPTGEEWDAQSSRNGARPQRDGVVVL